MGDARKDGLRVKVDSRIKLEFHGAAITSDAELIAYREIDEALALTQMGEVLDGLAGDASSLLSDANPPVGFRFRRGRAILVLE